MNPMRKDALTLATLVAATALSLLASSRARADCVDGVRAATAAELEFASRARAALIAALPAEPANIEWRGKRHDFAEQPKFDFCKGTAIGAFSPSLNAAYLYQFPAAEAERRSSERRQLQQQIEAIQALPPEKEAQRRTLLDQMRAAYDAAPRRSRKDPPLTPEQQTLADKQNTEGRRLEAMANKVAFDHQASVKPQTDPLRARADALQPGPQTFVVQLRINARSFPDAGAGATFGAPSANQSAGLKVHNVVLQLTGPQGAASETLFAAFDRAYLQGLIGQPLPEVAASQARAAKVMAAAPTAAQTSAIAAPARPDGMTGAPASSADPVKATAPAAPPAASQVARKDEHKKTESPGITAQDAANAVNKLKGLFGR